MMTVDIQKQTAPMVSIVMPAYNAEKFIKETVYSVINQTVAAWELIVVDDCSSDATVEVVEKIARSEPRIRILVNERNMGVAATRNRALELMQGEYVAFLDADDKWYADKLKKQIDLLKQTGADLVFTSYRLVQPSGQASSDYIVPERTTFEEMLCQNWIGCSTVLMKRSEADRYRFTTKYYHEDYVLWLDMLRQGAKMVGLPEVLVDYTYYPTSKAGNKLASAKYRWVIYRKHLRLPLWRSIGYLSQYAMAGVKKYRKVSG